MHLRVLCRQISSGKYGQQFIQKKFSSNFVLGAGFSPNTQSTDYGDRKLLLLENGQSLTYNDLNIKSGKFASMLSSKCGLEKGDRILCRVSKNVDAAALYLAALRLGLTYIPLNPAYTKNETEHFVKDAKPKLFITCDPETDSLFHGLVPEVISEQFMAHQAEDFMPVLDVEDVKGDDIACILYTSGTTGKPKGAMITHGGLTANAEVLADFWKFSADDVNLHALPFYHIHGLLVSFHCTLFSRSSTIFLPKFTVESYLKHLPNSTVTMGVPTFYARLVESGQLSESLVKNVRLFISGSATLTENVFDEFRKQTGQRICERYGMTETLVSTSNPVEPESARLAGSAGKPVPGVKVRVSKEGVIEVKSPSLFKGYLNLPEKTKQEFTDDGYFITGDMGEIDENGYVWIHGRQKDLIISGGLNVYPVEIERQLDAFEEIKESAVIGVPHKDFGEAVIAICELTDKKYNHEQLASTIREKLSKNLANYKRPKKIIFVDQFPKNHLGKVQKNLLRQEYSKLFSG